MTKGEFLICANCFNVGTPKTATKGSFLVELVLWLCFVVPGVMCTLWRLTTRAKVCRYCGAGNLVPLDSPRGRLIQREWVQPWDQT